MCLLDSASVYTSVSPNTETETLSYSREGVGYQKTVIKTPKGVLTSQRRRVATARSESTSWQVEWMFKGPEDYDALEFWARDPRYTPNYDGFLEARERMGGEAYFKTGAPGCPLHSIMYGIMGLDNFSIEWAERRDRVIALHEAIAENQRETYHIVAKSPAMVVQCGGNYAPEVLGKERFADYVLPHWEEVAGILHEGGKMLGCHLDANNRPWATEIGAAPLDWVEAFSPAPDTDLTVSEARELWPGKVLFINFPSAVHLESPAAIRETTLQLLRDSAPGDRFIIGITENVPENRWRESYRTILETANEFGTLPIDPTIGLH